MVYLLEIGDDITWSSLGDTTWSEMVDPWSSYKTGEILIQAEPFEIFGFNIASNFGFDLRINGGENVQINFGTSYFVGFVHAVSGLW